MFFWCVIGEAHHPRSVYPRTPEATQHEFLDGVSSDDALLALAGTERFPALERLEETFEEVLR
jgi:hypothetical protein